MVLTKWRQLQLFAEGAGDGADGGSGSAPETGVEAADPGRQRLLDLGVPASKIRNKTSKAVADMAAPRPEQPADKPATPPTEAPDSTQKPSWEELMQDEEYNRRMQETVQSRLRSAKSAQADLDAMAPAVEVLARKYGMDAGNLDYAALAKAINDDDAYYEERAMEMGVSVDQAKQMDQSERETLRQQRQQEATVEQMRIENHIRSLEQQGEQMKAVFPNFDLRQELRNPVFARMTSPNVGISVQDAYYAVHRQEIQQASMQAAVHTAAEKLSRAYQAGYQRPAESGSTVGPASVPKMDYRTATKEEREALKSRIRQAAARGEKIYPGM